jgi:hypothetical protein
VTHHDETHEFDRDDELRGLLASADPALSLTPADPAGLTALLEDLMTHETQTRPDPELTSRATGNHGRSPLTWLAAAAAVVMIAGAGAFGLSQMNDGGPTVVAGGEPSASEGTDPGSAATAPAVTQLAAPSAEAAGARCAVTTPSMLATQEQAFAGTVTAIDGDTVTLATTTVYAGDVGEQVQVTGPSPELHALLDAVHFEVGRDYLVSADGGVVSVCSFSGPASPSLQRLYDRAFTR